MKISYLLECYDVVFHQTISPITISNKTIFEELSINEKNSYRIFEIEINKNKRNDNLEICQTFHSLHPQVQELELKSIFHFNEFVKYIPVLKSIIEFTGENIFFAKHLECPNKFYVYEKCSITEIPAMERNLLYTHQVLKNENLNIKRAIKEQVFKYKSNVKIEHFIHKIQLALECQLHLVIKHIEPKTKKELYEYSNKFDKIDCLKCQFSQLEKLLVFLEREYINYLNNKSMVPYRTVLIDEVEIASKVEYVRNSLLSMIIEKELLQIIFDPLLNLTNLYAQEKISYYQYNFSKKYVIDIAKFIYENPNGITQLEWCNWLLEMQVNTFNFFDYMTSILKMEFTNCDTEIEKLELMFHYLKFYNQLKNWKFTVFIQPTKRIDEIINGLDEPYIFQEITLKASELKFLTLKYLKKTHKFDIIIFLKNYNLYCDTKTLQQAIFIILQDILGENSFFQNINFVQLAHPSDSERTK